MGVSVEVHKIIKCAIYSIAVFPSGGVAEDVLVRLPLMKQIIKNINSIGIASSDQHPHIFRNGE